MAWKPRNEEKWGKMSPIWQQKRSCKSPSVVILIPRQRIKHTLFKMLNRFLSETIFFYSYDILLKKDRKKFNYNFYVRPVFICVCTFYSLPQFPSPLSLLECLNVHVYAEIFLPSDIPEDARWLTTTLAYVRNPRLSLWRRKTRLGTVVSSWVSKRNFRDVRFRCRVYGYTWR